MIPELKIYTKERRYDYDFGKYHYILESEPISNYNVKVIANETNIFWRQKIWSIAFYRSMEIWKKIPANKVGNSIGELTILAQRSLSGIIGLGNGKYFTKDKNNNWNYIKWKERKYEKVFLPLSENAIQKCKERT